MHYSLLTFPMIVIRSPPLPPHMSQCHSLGIEAHSAVASPTTDTSSSGLTRNTLDIFMYLRSLKWTKHPRPPSKLGPVRKLIPYPKGLGMAVVVALVFSVSPVLIPLK